MLTSSDSCSMILVIDSVARNTRLAAPPTSTACPSPFVVATVPAGTRTDSDMAVVIAGNSNKFPAPGTAAAPLAPLALSPEGGNPLLGGMRGGEVAAAGLLDRLELHQLDANEIGIEHIELPFAVPAQLR